MLLAPLGNHSSHNLRVRQLRGVDLARLGEPPNSHNRINNLSQPLEPVHSDRLASNNNPSNPNLLIHLLSEVHLVLVQTHPQLSQAPGSALLVRQVILPSNNQTLVLVHHLSPLRVYLED